MSKKRIDIAKPGIISVLQKGPRVLRHNDLIRLLNRHRAEWRLPANFGFTKFVQYALEETDLQKIHLALAHRPETLYVVGEVPLLVVALAAKPHGYLTHYTAMSLHELTSQISKTIYVNVEQPPHAPNRASLAQENIDRAFRNQQRKTTNIAEHKDHRLVYLNGRFTARLGVMEHRLDSKDSVQVTDLERTLIDIAIRPAYSGGVAEVLEAYKRAASRVSVDRLASLLSEMELVYPYEQAVGFYLERAGTSASKLAAFRNGEFRFDFYLAHGIRELHYIPEWRLFVPQGL